METGVQSEGFTSDFLLPSTFEEYFEMENPLQRSLAMDDPVYTIFKMDNPDYEFSKMDSPSPGSSKMKAFFEETRNSTQQELRAEDVPRDENAKAQKKRDRQSQAAKEGRRVLARLPFFEDLSKQAGYQKPETIIEGLRKAREAQRAGNNPDDETEFENMSEDEREELGPWISRNRLKEIYRSRDAQPWYPKFPGLITKAEPKRAPIVTPKPCQPAQTDPPKRGRGRPRKYALDDPRSSLYRANRQKEGIRQSKKAARDFTIYEDNEGTAGISQSSKLGRSAAWLPLAPRRTPRLNLQLPRSVGMIKNPALATSGVGGGDPRGTRGLGVQLPRSGSKSHCETFTEEVEPDASSEASASPPRPGGGGKSVRRPSVEANFFPGMCPSETEIRDDRARLNRLALPGFKDWSAKARPPSPKTDRFWQTLKFNQAYYHEGGYMKDQSG